MRLTSHFPPEMGPSAHIEHTSKSLPFLIITSILMNSFVISADNLTPKGVPLSRKYFSVSYVSKYNLSH